MDHFRRQAFYQEFPFLHNLEREAAACEQIRVQQLGLDVLYREPHCCKIVGPGVGVAAGDEVWLFGAKGQCLGQVRTKYEVREPQQSYYHSGETVLAAIDRLGVAEAVAYLVWVEYGYRIWEHHSGGAWRATIYKQRQRVSLSEVVARAQAQAQALVAAESHM